MSDELREILEDLFGRGYTARKESYNEEAKKYVDIALQEIIRERKKWALSKKPKEKDEFGIMPTIQRLKNEDYNQALTDYVKNLEEG